MTKLLMRLMIKRDHRPTDTSHDYEYTDWEQVEGFARTCAAMVGGPARTVGAVNNPWGE